MTLPPYTVAETVDEFGQDRFFVEDEDCDWVEGPFDSYEEAAGVAQALADGTLEPQS